jgi:hypothetical protein
MSKLLCVLSVLVLGISLMDARVRVDPGRPERDDRMEEGFIIKQVRPWPPVYHSETLSFQSCPHSWDRLLDKFPELRPIVIEHGVEHLATKGIFCVPVDVIEQ